MLLRRVIGDALRARRQAQHRTLREVSTAANVSLGYLSEIERGQKEASSELLAAICEALGAALSEVLRDVSDSLAMAEELSEVLVPAAAEPEGATAPAAPEAKLSVEGRRPADTKHGMAEVKMSVVVHHHGPLKTTLRATRPSRERDVVYAG